MVLMDAINTEAPNTGNCHDPSCDQDGEHGQRARSMGREHNSENERKSYGQQEWCHNGSNTHAGWHDSHFKSPSVSTRPRIKANTKPQ
jgi:hypothetical protein